MKRYSVLWQRKILNVFMPAYIGCLNNVRFPSGDGKQDALMKIHLASLDWEEEDKYKNKLRLWTHKLAGGAVVVELEAPSELSQSTEEEVEIECGNMQDKNHSLKPAIEFSQDVSTNNEHTS